MSPRIYRCFCCDIQSKENNIKYYGIDQKDSHLCDECFSQLDISIDVSGHNTCIFCKNILMFTWFSQKNDKKNVYCDYRPNGAWYRICKPCWDRYVGIQVSI